MKILLVLITVAGFISGSTAQISPASSSKIDGIYMFVSETTTTTEPRREVHTRQTPDWQGIYIFHSGAYSLTLVNKKLRDEGIGSSFREFGESRAGEYKIDHTLLQLTSDVAFSTFEYKRPDRFGFQIDGDKLILRRKLFPHVEDLRLGEVVTILQRVSASKLKDL